MLINIERSDLFGEDEGIHCQACHLPRDEQELKLVLAGTRVPNIQPTLRNCYIAACKDGC